MRRAGPFLFGRAGEEKFLCLQLLDAIAQLRGLFELKFLGGFAHVRFQFSDVGVQFLLIGEFRHVSSLLGEVGVVGLQNPASDMSMGRRIDCGRDAVFLVVGLLNFAAAVGFVDGATAWSRSSCRHREWRGH